METLEAYKVKWSVSLVSTTKNKADGHTRVPKHWLTIPSLRSISAIALHKKFPNNCGLAEQFHTLHHCGIETDPSYSKNDEEFVKNCRECQSIDPSAVRINGGELSVEKDWKRLALDVTHHGCQKYLTIVDCGPSRFAIWRNIQNESESRVVSIVVVVWKGIHSRSDTNRTGAEGLSLYYPRLLHCLNQMLAVMLLSQHRVSSSKTVNLVLHVVPDV